MELNDEVCYRAMVSRDRRFDGRFFIAVVTTHIYCRPGCPARRPRRVNVRFYSHAAAAEAAGFRPCLRCRPEGAPGSASWSGTSATVSRALRLIDDGALEPGGVVALASRLGVTDRWLRRLFAEQIGASPAEVASTRRAHFARRLLDETALPLEDIAVAAGYGSARRLHAAIQSTFRRPPSALRNGSGALVRVRDVDTPSTIERFEVRVPAREPFDLAPLLEFFAARALRGVEQVGGDTYRRTVGVDRAIGVVEVSAFPGAAAVRVRTAGLPARALWPVVTRVSRVLDLAADVSGIAAHLRRDPLLAHRVPRAGVRVPGAWDPFEAGVRALLGQQISVAAARTLLVRLIERCGTRLDPTLANAFAGNGASSSSPPLTHLFPTAEQVANADLSQLGVPQSRANAVQAFARAVADGTLDLVTPRPLEEHVAALTALPGIGDWTAHYLAMRALGEPDAFPAGDLGVRQALAMAAAGGGSGELPSERAVLARAEAWRPWRAYAVIALWTGHSEPKTRTHSRTTKARRPTR